MRATLTEGKKEGAVAFFVGGDLNIEFRLIFTAWTVSIGTGCRDLSAEGAVRMRSLVKKIAVATALKDFLLHLDTHLDE